MKSQKNTAFKEITSSEPSKTFLVNGCSWDKQKACATKELLKIKLQKQADSNLDVKKSRITRG